MVGLFIGAEGWRWAISLTRRRFELRSEQLPTSRGRDEGAMAWENFLCKNLAPTGICASHHSPQHTLSYIRIHGVICDPFFFNAGRAESANHKFQTLLK